MIQPSILIVPGLYGSGPQHWQSLWERRSRRYQRVLQQSWEEPERDAWVDTLQRQVAACVEPPVLVAHSLGCAAVVHLARRFGSRVRAALLVAPCDVDVPQPLPESIRAFSPLPLERLPFPSTLVASTSDPYLELHRARALARAWNSRLVVLPDAGHINAASGLGSWPQGERLLERLIEESAPRGLEARAAL